MTPRRVTCDGRAVVAVARWSAHGPPWLAFVQQRARQVTISVTMGHVVADGCLVPPEGRGRRVSAPAAGPLASTSTPRCQGLLREGGRQVNDAGLAGGRAGGQHDLEDVAGPIPARDRESAGVEASPLRSIAGVWSRRVPPTRLPVVEPDSRGGHRRRDRVFDELMRRRWADGRAFIGGQRRLSSCHQAERFGRIVRVHL